MSRKIAVSALMLLLATGVAAAATESPPEPGVMVQVQAATRSFIAAHTVDGAYLHYDAATEEMRRLEFKMLHPMIAQEAGLFVARADFFDEQGRPVHMKFLVVMRDGGPRTLQAIAHLPGNGSASTCAKAS